MLLKHQATPIPVVNVLKAIVFVRPRFRSLRLSVKLLDCGAFPVCQLAHVQKGKGPAIITLLSTYQVPAVQLGE
jgi:hypothetical protein